MTHIIFTIDENFEKARIADETEEMDSKRLIIILGLYIL